MNRITLYHGTIHNFLDIDVTMGKGFKDFGKGFYTTSVEYHAVRMAKRNKLIEETRNARLEIKNEVNAYVHKFIIDMDCFKMLKVLEVSNADESWINFVISNRATPNKTHDFDIVIGATADDDTKTCFKAYMSGLYGKFGSKDALDILLKNLEIGNLPRQTYFGTSEAARLLVREGSVIKL